MSALRNHFFVLVQHIVPQQFLSRITGYFAGCKVHWFKTILINWFITRYRVDMRAACGETAESYENFNAFFTRRLKNNFRPITAKPMDIACPVDGTVGQFGTIRNDLLFQAKGHQYTLLELLGGDHERAKLFVNGEYATIYLSPRDYHRVHMPLAGTLREMVYIPGKLFSVNNVTTNAVPRLFARNERVICQFDTDKGTLIIVLVGAMIVSSIHTVWHGKVCPSADQITTFYYHNTEGEEIRLNKGAELGHFSLGSTVIVLFGANQMHWKTEFAMGNIVNFGELIGQVLH